MDEPECPLCLEPLAIDDINFYPCACRYQICRFCWHRIRTDEGGRCPHCRTTYSENPAEYNPPSAEQIAKLKNKGKKKNNDKKQKIVESRKSLSDVRVVQKNLVFVLGLSPRLADPEILKKQEYFGKYGKIFKVVINHHTVYNGTLGPSVSAYVTYQKEEDALRALLAVNNAFIDGRFLKASFGTTKYCSYFLRGLQCSKPDCMYLHELGDIEASFTKEDMQQGKHQDYELATLESFPLTTKDSPIKSFSSKSKPSTHSKSIKTQEPSALPLSSNWGSKTDKGPHPSRKVQKQLSVPHNSTHQPRLLQRTHSNPTRCHSNDNSRSTTPESLTSSLGSTQAVGGVSDKVGGTSSEGSGTSSDNNSERDFINEESWEVNTMGPHPPEEEGGADEEWGDHVTKEWEEQGEELPPVDVFKNLGVSSSGSEFGSIGVSWKGGDTHHRTLDTSNTSPSPLFMSLPWEEVTAGKETSSTLVDLLAGKKSQSSPPQSSIFIDERQRLASASYVNYGPTTNSPQDKSQLSSPPPSLGIEGKGDSLQSSLEDGFKSLFPHGGMPSLSLENAIQASSLSHPSTPPSSSSKLFHLFQNPPGGTTNQPSVSHNQHKPEEGIRYYQHTNSEWPRLEKSKIKSDVAPPPGFGHHHKPTAPPTYNLWGGGVNGLHGFIQQTSDPVKTSNSSVHVSSPLSLPTAANNTGSGNTYTMRQVTSPTTTTTISSNNKRPTTAPHTNVLDSTLFNAPVHNTASSSVVGGAGGGVKRTASPSLSPQQQQQLMYQQQQRALVLKQQQQQYATLMQQQMLRYHSMMAQQQQKRNNTSTTTNYSVNNPMGQYKPTATNKPEYPPLYYGGWYPAPYTWGVPHLAGNAANTGTTAATSRVGVVPQSVGGLHQTSSHQVNNNSNSNLEQKFQGMTFNS